MEQSVWHPMTLNHRLNSYEFVDIRENSVTQKGVEAIARTLAFMGIDNLPIGPPGFPDSTVLPVKDINRENIHWPAELYGSGVLGIETRIYDEASGSMVYPAVKTLDGIFELQFVNWNKITQDWDLVVAFTNTNSNVRILGLNTSTFSQQIEKPSPISGDIYKPNVLIKSLDDDESYKIKNVVEKMQEDGGTSLHIGAEAVMCLSNDDPYINANRARTASNLWKVIDAVAKNTGLPRPVFITNGYSININQMREIALGSGIPRQKVKNVILPPNANTMSHAPEMLKQLPSQLTKIPSTIVYVTSDEHLLRAGLDLAQATARENIHWYPFGGPSPRNEKLKLLISHEITRLKQHKMHFVKELEPKSPWDHFGIPKAAPLWALASMGWQVDL